MEKRKWTQDYDQPEEESRFQTFQKNYLDQWKHSLSLGTLFHLDETKSIQERDYETFFRRKYDNWASKYGKAKDEPKYQTFKANLIRQLEYNQENEKCYSMNEFGDWTQAQWYEQQMQNVKNAAFVYNSKSATLTKPPSSNLDGDSQVGTEKSDPLENAPYFMSDLVKEVEHFGF